MKTTLLACLSVAALASSAHAIVYDITIKGSDAIFLAGRTDLTIPDAHLPWTGPGDYLIRHGGATPEEIKETFPPYIPVVEGDVVKAADPALGGVNFFLGFGPPYFGPSGNGSAGSELTSLGKISGYKGPQGPLTGVFIDDSIPSGAGAPATLDFTPAGLGTDFLTLSPLLGQIFYIGDGLTSSDVFQTFIAPIGATRLFLGIPDGFGFGGAPGAYDDNDGSYRVRIGVNQDPRDPVTPRVPDAASTSLLLGLGLAGVAAIRRRFFS